MKHHSKRLLLLIVLISLGGCNALKISEANQALSNHYFAKEQAQQAAGSMASVALLDNINVALKDLANETFARGNEEDNPKNKIAFYRIAATAAWQSGLEMTTDYAKPGQDLCRVPENRVGMEVNCSFLAFIPIFSALDSSSEKVTKLNVEQAALSSSDDAKRQDLLAQAQALFGEFKLAASSALLARKDISSEQLSKGFIAKLDENLVNIVCKQLSEVISTVSTLDGNPSTLRSSEKDLKMQLGEIDGLSCQ
ncbi:hypothetical protein [Glaciecola sp. SC05]|uniref:hypothetical protein n=1 Tax=Glaciecola sp. SC05 TaxID=1987355 RepID=UPI003526CB24